MSRARAVPRVTGSVSSGPVSDALTCAGMSSGPSSVWVHAKRSGTTVSNHVREVAAHVRRGVLVQRQRRADVCWSSRWQSPTRSSPSSGSASTISRVTR